MSKDHSRDAPGQLYELREWLLDRIDGGEETRGEDGLVSNFIRQIDAATAELNDLKQRILPQYVGRAERAENAKRMAEHERDSMLEKLRAATSMPCASSATAAPVAWMYEESGERMFGHPDGYRPKDAVPLYAGSPPVEEAAIGHARYEYLRTLNPREFAVLWDESIYDPFDDLVDRRRMKGEKP